MGVLCNPSDSHLTSTVIEAPSALAPVSITCWMSGTWSNGATVTKSFVGLYGPSAAAPTTAIQIGSRATNNTVYVWTYGGGLLVSTGAGVVSDGTNHFIAYTFDGTTHLIYVDGVLQGTATNAVNPQLAGSLNTFYINGYPPGGTPETSNHQVESVRLYGRTLSANEILTMYNSRGARHNIAHGMLAYYEFDEGAQGTTTSTCIDYASGTPAPLSWTGAGTPMTYTYSIGEAKLRPPAVN